MEELIPANVGIVAFRKAEVHTQRRKPVLKNRYLVIVFGNFTRMLSQTCRSQRVLVCWRQERAVLAMCRVDRPIAGQRISTHPRLSLHARQVAKIAGGSFGGAWLVEIEELAAIGKVGSGYS